MYPLSNRFLRSHVVLDTREMSWLWSLPKLVMETDIKPLPQLFSIQSKGREGEL